MAYENAIFAAMGAMLVVVLVFGLAIYIYSALALMFIAKKTKTKNGWLAFIPIANFYLMTQMAKKPAWWTLALLFGVIPFLGGLAVTAVSIYLFWIIAERIHKPGWWSLLLMIPVVNFVIMGIMAWGK